MPTFVFGWRGWLFITWGSAVTVKKIFPGFTEFFFVLVQVYSFAHECIFVGNFIFMIYLIFIVY